MNDRLELNETATAVVRLLTGAHTVPAIVDRLAERYTTAPGR